MTKILFLVTQSEFGGAQRYIFEVARNLNKTKYEILVAAGQGDGELFRKLQRTETRSLYLKQMKRAPRPWQMILAVKEIFDLLKRERPDILFLCSTTAGFLGSIARVFYKVKTIYRIGGWAFRDPRPFWQNWLIFWAEKLTAPLKDKIVVNSEVDREIAIKSKIASPVKIVKIYNGIDSGKLDFLSKEEARKNLLRSDLNNFWVGTVANFYKTKGLKYLIEAAHTMFEAKPRTLNAKFIIIGEGHQRPELEALIKKYDLKNQVFLVGRIPDAYRYLKAFDVFVLPSLKEGFPWIILEAMAAELPIVGTRVGALPEIIEDGKEGFLIQSKNSQILAEKINWLLKNPRKARVLGIQAKAKLVGKFSLPKMIKETERII